MLSRAPPLQASVIDVLGCNARGRRRSHRATLNMSNKLNPLQGTIISHGKTQGKHKPSSFLSPVWNSDRDLMVFDSTFCLQILFPTPTTHLQTWNWIGIQLLLWIGRVEVKAHGPWRSTRRQKSRVTSCGPLNFMTYELPMILEQRTYSASVWMCCKNKYKISPQFIQIFHSQIQYLRENLKHPVLCTGTIFDPINARSHTVALEC